MPFTHSSARNLAVVCAATVGGIVVGGASVLSVALAVMEPASRDAPAGSAVFDGQSHAVVRSAPDVVQPAPTALQGAPQASAAPAAPAVTPAVAVPLPAPLQPRAATPVETQATPPASAAPAASASINASMTAAGTNNRRPVDNANQQTSTKTRTVTRAVASRDYSQTSSAPDTDMTRRRTIVVVPANPQQARGDDPDEASTEAPRPLFDFFGNFGDSRRSDDRDASSQPQTLQPRGAKNPRDPRLAVPQRRSDPQSDPDDGDDAANVSPQQYDRWGNFFGYSRNDNWRN